MYRIRVRLLTKFLPGDTASWVEMIQTNILAGLHCISVFLPGMRAGGRGHIVNIGSSNSREPAAGMAVYSGTKVTQPASGDISQYCHGLH